ncbi:MAG: FtsW/RodA/SpoVE family cell cycle protein [Alphaproteobacteria bacterium]|jgi:cell division protein FtsW
MNGIARGDNSIVGRWWWTVDRSLLVALLTLMAVGLVLVIIASPGVAERIDAPTFHFVKRHLMLLPVAIILMVGCSLLNPRQTRLLALAVLAGATLGLIATLFIGSEIKGARRWISIGGFSLQASEFAKPAMAVLVAWMLTQFQRKGLKGYLIGAVFIFGIPLSLTAIQPDVGTSLVMLAVLGAQLFVAGISLWAVTMFLGISAGGFWLAYLSVPHVTSRVDRFLDPATGDTYQIDMSLNAFHTGGLVGRGPGDGVVKNALPDAHSDFIFAVAGEELGLIACLIIVGIFAFVVLKIFVRALSQNDLFTMLAGSGLASLFGAQALVNLSSTLALIPTKGMTLPFISYGGSSLFSLAIAMGLALAITRRRTGLEDSNE